MFERIKELFCSHVWFEPDIPYQQGFWRRCIKCGRIETVRLYDNGLEIKLKFYRSGNDLSNNF